jgi:hypothetical protein
VFLNSTPKVREVNVMITIFCYFATKFSEEVAFLVKANEMLLFSLKQLHFELK